MRKKIFKIAAIIIGIFVICQGVNITQIKTMILQPKYSLEKQTSYSYMAISGNVVNSTAGGAQSNMIYELLLAISNKYGENAATIYYSCMQSGSYEAYYNAIGSKTPSYNEGFVYSTNGNKQEMTSSQMVEQALINTGYSNYSELMQAAIAAGYENGYKYATAIKLGKVSQQNVSNESTQAANEQPETVTEENTNTEQATEVINNEIEEKEISHGIFDDISDEAEKAFAELLSDGVDESCYIQVKADAEDRTISVETVSKTLSQKEDGRVEFYNKGENEDYSEFSYSVTFPQIEVDEDIDLAATYALLDTSKYEDVYQLAFVTEQSLSSEVEITLNVNGSEGEKYYLLRGNDDSDYNNFTTAECDENGYISFTTNKLDNIIVTTTDIVSMRQAEEEALAKAEQEALEKEQETTADTDASTAEISSDASDTQMESENETNTNNILTYILTGFAILAFIVAFISLLHGIRSFLE